MGAKPSKGTPKDGRLSANKGTTSRSAMPKSKGMTKGKGGKAC